MSAAPRYPDCLPTDAPYTGLRMTADQYLALGETQERYELIDGVVCMSPSPTPAHQEIKVALASQIMATDLADGRPRVYLDTDVRFSGNLVYCPDLSVYQRSRLPATPKRLTVTPDLIVEVLLPSNRGLDLVTKRDDFERFGVAEY